MHHRKQKETEKSLDNKYTSKKHLRRQEKVIYSSLSKTLFDVQQMHSSLSGVSLDNECITNAVKQFDLSVSKYHKDISKNMLYMSSQVINLIYKFYRQINDFKVEIKEISNRQVFDVVLVSVFYSARGLADTVIEIQEIFIKELSVLKVHFDKTQQEMMRSFCGPAPSEALIEKYKKFKQTLAAMQGE
jgi:hypothetical protein